jgi:hypothetical protein
MSASTVYQTIVVATASLFRCELKNLFKLILRGSLVPILDAVDEFHPRILCMPYAAIGRQEAKS